MRVAFDLDGVLADLHKAFAETALRLYPDVDAALLAPANVAASPADDKETDENAEESVTGSVVDLPLTRRQSAVVWRELCAMPDFWESLSEIEPGAIARLGAIAEEHRWEVMFLTSRPKTAGRTVQRQSQRWLERMGFALPSVYVVEESRGRIAGALAVDVVIDDRPDNCLDVVLESRARAILVWRGSPQSVPTSAQRMGIGVVPTVAACLDVLLEAERAASTPADLVQRLRKLLGLQTKPPHGLITKVTKA